MHLRGGADGVPRSRESASGAVLAQECRMNYMLMLPQRRGSMAPAPPLSGAAERSAPGEA